MLALLMALCSWILLGPKVGVNWKSELKELNGGVGDGPFLMLEHRGAGADVTLPEVVTCSVRVCVLLYQFVTVASFLHSGCCGALMVG